MEGVFRMSGEESRMMVCVSFVSCCAVGVVGTVSHGILGAAEFDFVGGPVTPNVSAMSYGRKSCEIYRKAAHVEMMT